MSTSLATLGGLQRPGLPVLERARLRSPATLVRAQITTRATLLGADGLSWSDVGADTPRFHAAARRLLLEGQRTNLIRNARGEGALAGTPGTLPTNWSSSTSAGGIARSVLGYETINGVSCVLVRFAGTASANGTLTILWEPAAQLAGTAGQVFAVSAVLRAVHAGTAPTLRLGVREVPSNTDHAQIVTADASLRRATILHTVVDTAATSLRPGLSILFLTGQVIDTTIAIGFAQTELARFASSPILPAPGAPATATRGADLVQVSLASLGIGTAGACTLLGAALVPETVSDANQHLLSIDDGAGNNMFHLYVSPAGQLVTRRVTAGNAASLTRACPANTLFRFGISIDGAGRMASTLDGAAVQAVTGGPSGGLGTLRLGHRPGGSEGLFGEIASLQVLRFAVSDAALVGMAAAQPG